MKIDSHELNLKESVEEIKEAIKKGIEEKQRTIGFHTSSGAADMLEIILHKKGLVDPGFILKHDWFNSKNKVADKLNFDFPRKEEIIGLIYEIESLRNSLCYGRRRKEEEIMPVIISFNKLKEIFDEVVKNGL